jgi:hypothetical protein
MQHDRRPQYKIAMHLELGQTAAGQQREHRLRDAELMLLACFAL